MIDYSHLENILKDALKDNLNFKIKCSDGEIMYDGIDISQIKEELDNMEEAYLIMYKNGKKVSTLFLVLECYEDPEEIVCDYSVNGWIDSWYKKYNSSTY